MTNNRFERNKNRTQMLKGDVIMDEPTAERAKIAEAWALVGGKIAAERKGNRLVTAFHPELSTDGSVHRYFAEMVRSAGGEKI